MNIGVLVFDPQTGDRRLRLIEEPEKYARVRRLHSRTDEELLARCGMTWRTGSRPPHSFSRVTAGEETE